MPQRYNLALLPHDPEFRVLCNDFAQRHFSELQDGSILGPKAMPHITLCHVMAEPEQLPDLWQAAVKHFGRGKLGLSFSHIYFSEGKAEHAGSIWAGFAVTRDSNLMVLQASVNGLLRLQGLLPLHATGDAYFPHVTLARLRRSGTLPAISWPDEAFWSQSHDFTLSLGRSDDNGVYQAKLYPETS